MDRDNSDGITHSIEALAIFRGIYKRVAVQLDVDPSYVSRVARGERRAPFVTEALRKEIQRVLGKAGLHDSDGHNNNHGHDHSPGMVAAALEGHSLDAHHAPIRKKKSKTRAPNPVKSKRRS